MLNLNQLKKLYVNSPLWVKKLYASIPYEIRNGNEYRKWKVFLDKNLNEEEYTLLKMKENVLYAYKNTNYYKTQYDKLDISPYDLNDLGDFKLLPIIDKDIVRNNFDDFIVKKYNKNKTFYVTTGGSSGEPMKFLQSKNIWAKELAFGMHYFAEYGYEPSMMRVSFRGGDFNDLKNNQFWKYNPIHNELHFSPFHINSNTIYSYVKDLNKFQLKYFHGYPSSFLLLMEHMKANQLTLDYDINAIFLISENFTEQDVESIRSFFNCDVSSVYGHSERLVFAPSHSKDLTTYRVNKRYGYFEIIDDKSEVINDNNQRGEIVGSSFDNYVMPLIRYNTNDYTSYVDVQNSIISLIDGRWTKEYLLGKNGFKLYLTALNMHSDIFKNVIKFQYHQDEIAKIELQVIVTKDFTEIDKNNILSALNQKAGHAMNFRIKMVEQLELTKRGKFNNVVRTV